MLMKYLADEIENPVGKMKELLLEPENPELLPQLERCVEYMSEMIDGMKEYQLSYRIFDFICQIFHQHLTSFH